MNNCGCGRNYYVNSNLQNTNSNQMETMCNNLYMPVEYSNNCECGFENETQDVFPVNPMLAQSYVPYQFMNKTFKPSIGLKNGTIFPELVSKYMAGDSMKDINYIRNSNIVGKGCNS